MKIKRFSTLEISLSAFLIVAVAVFLINQLVMMSRNNLLVRQKAITQECSSNLRDFIEVSVNSSSKMFKITAEGELFYLSDADSSEGEFAGIAVSIKGHEDELKIFKREKRFGHETYTYSVYKEPDSITDRVALEEKNKLIPEQDLLETNCKASSSKPFTLKNFLRNEAGASITMIGIEDEVFHIQNSLVFSKLLWKGTDGI